MWLVPKRARTDRVLLCLHGGAFVSGSIYTHRTRVLPPVSLVLATWASDYVDGLLSQITVGRRNRAFEAPAIVNAFTDLERQLASPDR